MTTIVLDILTRKCYKHKDRIISRTQKASTSHVFLIIDVFQIGNNLCVAVGFYKRVAKRNSKLGGGDSITCAINS